MPARVSRRPRAQQDLIEIWIYIARENAAAADRLIDRIDTALTMLSKNTEAGRDRSDLVPGLRSFLVGTYILFYIPRPGHLDLVRVLSGYRDIDSALLV